MKPATADPALPDSPTPDPAIEPPAILPVAELLAQALRQAARLAAEAAAAARRGEANLAVGTLMEAESHIDQVAPLYAALLAIHRAARPSFR